MIPAKPDLAAMFRVSMAAIDPDAAPQYEDDVDSKPPRATLRLVRPPPGMELDEDYEDEEDSEEESNDEEVNGGPSDKEKAKRLKEAAALKVLADAMDEDDSEGEEEVDIKTAISKLIKGKAPATDGDSDDDSDEELDLEEIVICTLDPEKQYQQALDITVSEDERIFFKVTGTHAVYLTGNYVVPNDEGRSLAYDEDGEDEDNGDDEYDFSPDEELGLDDIIDEDEESDGLDELENPRITEVESDEEIPKLVNAKGKNKRAAAGSDEEAGLDELIAKDAKSKAATNGDTNISKKQQKKLKKNNGEAASVDVKKETKDAKESPTPSSAPSAKVDKKVQFAKNLEQGPLSSSQDKKSAAENSTGTLGIKDVQGVRLDDKKLGKGPVAKSGNTVSLRYIGKLEDGKVFDANKKGKPFTFKIGKGEVIKGWDIGITGMAAGGERRIIIPSHLAYGKKAHPGIPANSRLVFDVKLLEIK